MDKILIKNLRAKTLLGLYPHERLQTQQVIFTLCLFVDTLTSGITDNISDTVDYEAVSREIVTLCESSSFKLVEALANRVATLVLEKFKVSRILVTVEKRTIDFADAVMVEVDRSLS